MQLLIKNGQLQENATVCFIASPNCDERQPADKNIHQTEPVSLLVIHHISLPPHEFGGDDITDFFTNQLDSSKHPFYETIKELRVSAHVLIKRNGEVIQFVNFNQRAWHAGTSAYQDREACNDFSIGIELEGDEITPYRYAQYKMLATLTDAISVAYPKIGANIVGHEDIAPNRKTDPGPTFDWDRYQNLCEQTQPFVKLSR